MKKRILSIVLAALMVIMLFPATALADGADTLTFTVITKDVNGNVINQVTGTGSSVTGTGGSASRSSEHYDDWVRVWDVTANPISGYKFTGWSGSGLWYSNSTNPNTIRSRDGDKSISATFQQLASYTLTTSVSSGSGSITTSPAGTSFSDGTPVKLTANPSAGWRFGGWSGDASGGTNPITITMNGNKNVAASFVKQHYITLNSTSGGHFDNESAVEGWRDENLSINLGAAAPDNNSGYRFIGWRDDLTGEMITDYKTTNYTFTLAGNRTFTAMFGDIEGLDADADDTNKGYLNVDIDGMYGRGAKVNLNDADPRGKTGYTFSHWEEFSNPHGYGDGTPVALVNGQPIITIGDSNYFRAFFNVTDYTITYNLGSGTVSPANPSGYTYFTPTFQLNNPVKPGYTFDGWTGTGLSTMKKNVTVPTHSSGDRTYTANWTAITYGITYNNHGTVAGNPTTYTAEDSFTLVNPTRGGYQFTGWTGTGLSGLTMNVSVAAGNTGARTYTANWTPASYSIGYDLDGGSVSPANPTGYTIESGAITLNNPTKNGYTFAGWSGTGIVGTSMSVTIPAGSTGDRDYTATWTVISYGITYNNYGTVAGNPTSYTIESSFTLSNPARSGYEFIGWTGTGLTGATMSVSVAAGNTEARTYTANWKVADISVTGFSGNYDGVSHGVTVTGNLLGDTITYSTDGVTYGSTEPRFTNATSAGGETVYVKVERAGTAPYYGSAVVQISKVALTVDADDKSITYGDLAPVYTASYIGFIPGEDEGVLGGILAFDCDFGTASTDADSYTITPKGLTSGNYDITFTDGTLTVNKKAATITANDKSKTYGEADPALDAAVTGAVSGETLDYSLSRVAGENVGDYDIIVTLGVGAVNDNYIITTNDGTLTIDHKAATITANDKSKTYSEADPTLDAAVTGTVNGETLDYSLSREPGENADDYNIIVTLGTDAVNKNYSITANDGTLTINRKAATITANDKSKTYGEADPALDAAVTGTVNGETLDYSLSRVSGENAGDYDIVVTLGTGAVNDNYSIIRFTGTLTINRKAATITANDKSKTYGEADPALDAAVAGTVNGETLDYSLSREAGENVGDYDIIMTLGTGAVNNNYSITLLTGTLTVGKKALTVTADNKAVTFLDASPAYTASYSGFVAGDDAGDLGGTLALDCSYAAGSAVGTYAITPSGFTSGNYNITFVPGTLTVNTLYLTVRFVNFNGVVLGTDTVAYGTEATAPANPTRTGYRFTGWDTDFDDVRTDLTVRAQYAINRYTVTFVDFDGTVIDTQRVNWNSGADAPTAPEREGYTFAGWDENFDPVTSNLTVTALYNINTYTVRFLDFDGTALATQTVNWNTAAAAPEDPSREGYTFIGWDVEFGAITADLTVTAQYEQVQVIDNEVVPGTDDTKPLDDEDVPLTGAAGLAWYWWLLIAASAAALVFFLIFFVWKRRRKEEEQQI